MVKINTVIDLTSYLASLPYEKQLRRVAIWNNETGERLPITHIDTDVEGVVDIIFGEEEVKANQCAFVMLKPEAIQYCAVGTVLEMLSRNRFHIEEMDRVRVNRTKIEAHYEEHKDKPFFEDLVSRFQNEEVIILKVWYHLEPQNPIKRLRELVGATNPLVADEGTIRHATKHIQEQYGKDNILNVVHASDSLDAANREIDLWFPH